eukprot:1148384-Rhodomonas_salina.1
MCIRDRMTRPRATANNTAVESRCFSREDEEPGTRSSRFTVHTAVENRCLSRAGTHVHQASRAPSLTCTKPHVHQALPTGVTCTKHVSLARDDDDLGAGRLVD